jgi:hypothetical protein
LFARSRQCTDATQPESRAHCVTIKTVEGDLARANEAVALETDLRVLQARIASAAPTDAAHDADVQSALIAQVTGWPRDRVQLGLQLLFVVMVEAGACLMLGAALTFGQSQERAPRRDTARPVATERGVSLAPGAMSAPGYDNADEAALLAALEAFLLQTCLRVAPDRAIISSSELKDAFQSWWGGGLIPSDLFNPCLAKVCQRYGLERRRHDDTIYVLGIVIGDKGSDDSNEGQTVTTGARSAAVR